MVKVASKKQDNRRGIDHIGVTAVAVVHDGKGKILLQKRGPHARDEHGHWDVVGGAVEFGETIIETMQRELLEEIGAVPQEIKFLNFFDAHRHQNGQQTHWVAVVHTVLVEPNTITIREPHKIAEIGWFTADSLPKPLHSQFPKVHKLLVKHKILR